MSSARRDSCVFNGVRIPSRPGWYSTRVIARFRLKVYNGEPKRLADSQAAGQQQLEQPVPM
jgi:hypothetical protein